MSTVMTEREPSRHRITVDEYYRMEGRGLIAPDARVELIEGEIIDMPPIGSAHAAAVSLLQGMLYEAVAGRAVVRGQLPLRLGRDSELVPDLTVVQARSDFYSRRHPMPPDTLLVVEVSESSLRYDLKRKTPLYARHGVPELWVMDIARGRLHLFRSPENGEYSDALTTESAGTIELSALPGAVANLSRLQEIL